MIKIITLVTALLLPLPAMADSSKVLGAWKLVSFVTEFQDGSPSRQVFGENARGHAVYTPQGRYMVMLEADGRKPPKSPEERTALFNSMIAFTGMYKIEGDQLVVEVDGALNPSFTRTSRVSTLKFDGDRMHALSPWAPSPVLPGTPMARGVTVWERVK